MLLSLRALLQLQLTADGGNDRRPRGIAPSALVHKNRRVLSTWSDLAPLAIQAHAGADCTLKHLLRLGIVDLVESPQPAPPSHEVASPTREVASPAREVASPTRGTASGRGDHAASNSARVVSEAAAASDALPPEPLVVLKPMEAALAIARLQWVELPDASMDPLSLYQEGIDPLSHSAAGGTTEGARPRN